MMSESQHSLESKKLETKKTYCMVLHKVQKLRKSSMAVQVLGRQSSLEKRTRLLGGNSDPVVLGMLSV